MYISDVCETFSQCLFEPWSNEAMKSFDFKALSACTILCGGPYHIMGLLDISWLLCGSCMGAVWPSSNARAKVSAWVEATMPLPLPYQRTLLILKDRFKHHCLHQALYGYFFHTFNFDKYCWSSKAPQKSLRRPASIGARIGPRGKGTVMPVGISAWRLQWEGQAARLNFVGTKARCGKTVNQLRLHATTPFQFN